MEKAARRRTTRKTVMHVGGWDLLGCEGTTGEIILATRKACWNWLEACLGGRTVVKGTVTT